MSISCNSGSGEATGAQPSDTRFESKLVATFEDICRYACELLKVDHSGFVRFNNIHTEGEVVAQYPVEPRLSNRKVKLQGIPAEERLLESDEPLVIEDVANASQLGEVQTLLAEFDIRSICIVTVQLHGTVIGSFSLDSVGKTRAFTKDEIARCRSFADLASKTIEHAGSVDWLEALLRATAAITSEREIGPLLESIIQHASALFRAESVGLYQRCADEQGFDSLRLVASTNQRLVGKVLHRGEGMAWQVVAGTAKYLATDDYDKYPHRAIPLEGNFGSVLEVPLERQHERIGVIYLTDAAGRKFNDFDAELLQRFANVAMLALQQRGLFGRMKELSDATTAISGDLGSNPLAAKLTAIAEHATRILNAEMCGVFQVDSSERLILQASYGHPEGQFEQNRVFVIQDEPGTGFAGALAARLIQLHGDGASGVADDLIIKLCGEEIRGDRALEGVDAEASGACHSLLAIPLLTKSGERETVSGMLRITNKKGADGEPHDSICFNEEDVWILRVFADAVVVAIESTRLFEELRAQKNLYEQLLSTWNTLASEESLEVRLNKIAENIVIILRKSYCRILLAEESDEVLTLKAVALHPRSDSKSYRWNPERKQRTAIALWPRLHDAFRSGQPYELSAENDSDGTLAALAEILGLRDADSGVAVPIQSVFSIPMRAGDRPVGLISVGELRKTTQERGGFSREAKNLASTIAAQATVMIDREWKRQTSERREELLSRLSDAAVLIRAEADGERRLSVIAQQAQQVFRCNVAGFLEQVRLGGPVAVHTSTGEQFTITDDEANASGLSDLLAAEVMAESISSLFESIAHSVPALQRLELTSSLAVRFDYASLARCVLFVGEKNEAVPLRRGDLRILDTLAAHCAASLSTATARAQLTRALNGVHLVAEDLALGDRGHALDKVVQGIKSAMNSDLVTLYRIKMRGTSITGFPTKTMLQDPSASSPFVRDVSRTAVGRLLAAKKSIIMVDDVTRDEVLNGPFVEREQIVSALGMPILAESATSPVGVLFVNYTTFHKFTHDDEKIVKMFAHLASVAIRNQELYDRQRRKAKQQESLRKAARALSKDLQWEETPQHIADTAYLVATSFIENVVVVVVGLFENSIGRVAATFPADAADAVRKRLGHEVPLVSAIDGRIGIVGRAVLTGKTQVRNDVSEATDSDYIAIHDLTKSQLAVSITQDDEQLGAISIESSDPFAFEEEDRETFELLASFAFDALRTARKNDDLERMRAGAQPDAVWKAISFSAAHKIGNPIFAIETNLGPLRRRVTEQRTGEAVSVIDDIQISVEKAKGIVHQFRSLSLAQDIHPVTTYLRPILEQACVAAHNQGIATAVECSEYARVLGDQRRLAECFDELAANALHWLGKSNPQINITVSEASSLQLPEGLDPESGYLLIHFRDNGSGVPVRIKKQIFDAFFTTYEQGNGLGLDLVRRIIVGHGGTISEVGTPGDGADFEIYLPIPEAIPRAQALTQRVRS